MLWRALLAFLALPGIVAIAVPAGMAAGILRAGGHFHAVGLLPLGLGFALPSIPRARAALADVNPTR